MKPGTATCELCGAKFSWGADATAEDVILEGIFHKVSVHGGDPIELIDRAFLVGIPTAALPRA